MPLPQSISGYVFAGGRSSRMGRDKALLSLAGRPLIEHAVTKLRRICADVHILSADPALASFAPIVPDLHLNCGPIGGIEAALMHAIHDWNLFLPVDLPFVPTGLLAQWILDLLGSSNAPAPGIRIFTRDGRPQPGLCLIHRAVAPLITRAILREEFALISIFEEVGRELPSGLAQLALDGYGPSGNLSASAAWPITDAQRAARDLWFLNVNTRQDLAIAEANLAALDI